MIALPRIAWTERSGVEAPLLLVIDTRPLAGLGVAGLLACAPVLSAPLGRLGSPFALLVVLPALALALEAFGWRERLARALARPGTSIGRLLTAYGVWLATSALLTLDVAAVVAGSVGVTVAGGHARERRWQLGSAVLGANVGSLLLPFSNLTNLVLVSATGIGFAAYVQVALAPQLAVAAAVGLLLALRARHDIGRTDPAAVADDPPARRSPDASLATTRAARAAGAVAVLGALGAIAAGLTGADIAIPFAISSAVLVGAAIASGRLRIGAVARSLPLTGLAILMIAAVAAGPIAHAASLLPHAVDPLGVLVVPLVVGGVLAAVLNNLPAAAFGGAWLATAHPASVVAYLIGTNVVAMVTPHGSVATILARSLGSRNGVEVSTRQYLRWAWLYALLGAAAATVALAAVAR